MENKSIQPDEAKFDRIGSLCVCANLRKASRGITNLYDAFLQPSGLLATQFILLSGIGGQRSIALTPLAEMLGMDPTTLARNLKPLERDGLIQILTGTDRRTRLLSLTDHGRDRFERAFPLWEQAQASVIGQVGEARWRVMLGDWADLVSLSQQ